MPTPTTDPPRSASPPVVAFLRSLLILLVLAVLGAIIDVFTSGSVVELVPEQYRALAAALIVILVRTLEGVVDKLRGQAPQVLLGSAPVDPLTYIDTTATLTAPQTATLASVPDEAIGAELTRRLDPPGGARGKPRGSSRRPG